MTAAKWETVICRTYPDREVEVSPDVTAQVSACIVVAGGEYADQGEPDLLLTIQHAVDEDGNDLSAQVARDIAAFLSVSGCG